MEKELVVRVPPPPSVEPVMSCGGQKTKGREDGVSQGPSAVELLVSGGAEGDGKH